MEVTLLPFLDEMEEGLEEVTVSYWKVEEGDHVDKEEDLVEITTSKAVYTIPSPVSGTVEKILVQEGETVKVDRVLCIIRED